MEAGFFKWSSASFLFIPFLCFFTEEIFANEKQYICTD